MFNIDEMKDESIEFPSEQAEEEEKQNNLTRQIQAKQKQLQPDMNDNSGFDIKQRKPKRNHKQQQIRMRAQKLKKLKTNLMAQQILYEEELRKQQSIRRHLNVDIDDLVFDGSDSNDNEDINSGPLFRIITMRKKPTASVQ